jgi:large subunit ribosomal protein L30
MSSKTEEGTVEVPRKLRVTYSVSSIGVVRNQKQTIQRLGLRRLGQTVEHYDTPAVRGMLHKVRHLITVVEVE